MTDHLMIRRGGRLVKVYWTGEDTPEDEEPRWAEEDITDRAITHLFWPSCELAEGVTLRDIFLLVDQEIDLFNLVLGNWCKEFTEEGLKPPPDEEEKEIEYLQLAWYVTINKRWVDNKETDEKVTNISTFPRFDGVGFAPERINYGVDGVPANKLARLPLRLGKELMVLDEDEEHRIWHEGHAVNKAISDMDFSSCRHVYPNPDFSLADILYGIFWEISFYGSPKNRDDKMQDLQSTVAEVRSGKFVTLSLDDLLKKD